MTSEEVFILRREVAYGKGRHICASFALRLTYILRCDWKFPVFRQQNKANAFLNMCIIEKAWVNTFSFAVWGTGSPCNTKTGITHAIGEEH